MPIEVKHLNHTYMQGTPFEAHALKDVNLTVHDGEFIGIIGHTGSGKSTLISHLNALDKPRGGHCIRKRRGFGRKGCGFECDSQNRRAGVSISGKSAVRGNGGAGYRVRS